MYRPAESAVGGELSVFLTTPAAKDSGQVYRDALGAIRLADALGYACAWVAEAHLSSTIGVPAALSLLAAATQAATRIRLGTAVIPLAFDNPLRLAETAALVNALSDQRLELGVGKGNPRGLSTDAFTAFGLDEGDRNQLYGRALAALKVALGGPVRAGEKELNLYPPADDLLTRMWQATGDHATAAAAAAAGDGLMLFRTTVDGVAGDVQARLIDVYLDSFVPVCGDPRIGVSRALLLASSRREAIKIATAAFQDPDTHHAQRPDSADAQAVEDFLITTDVVFGSPDDIVDALGHDGAVARSTSYLFSLPFTPSGSPAFRDGLEALATEIYPRLQRELGVPSRFRP